MPKKPSPGGQWVGYRPRTVVTARPTEALELIIDKEHRGSGFVLTVLDLDKESGDTSIHATVEEAKAAAVEATGLTDLRWQRP